MRCRTCDYALWNLTARECPECGAPFKPSEYEFNVETVEFCCPHCRQAYYGTGFNGHLQPTDFECVNCNQPVTMDEMLVRPVRGLRDSQTQRDENPWLRRRERNWFKAWIKTIGMSMGQPFQLMRPTPPADATAEAWRFAMATALLIGLLGYAVPMWIFAAVAQFSGDPSAAIGWGLSGLGFIIGYPIAKALVILIWGGVTHGVLALFGGTNESIGRTMQALCYSSGVNAPTIMPCIGPYCLSNVTGVWWIVSAILMVKEGHRISGGRATIATLVFPLTAILLIAAAYALLIVGIMSTSMRAARAIAPAGQVQLLTQAIQTYAAGNGDTGPPHVASLIGDGLVTPWDFIDANSGTDPATIQLTARYTLDDFQFASFENQAAIAQNLSFALPAGVTAHRLGDYVFTYHGIDFANDNGRLWMVIEAPESGAGYSGVIWIGLLDGTSTPLSSSLFTGALNDQNKLRGAAGLPPLVDPLNVTHEQPETNGGE